MNVIKKLELFGFKSFYNRKEVSLRKNMNVFMGPNGSGKSNIAEGISFALGKSSRKELRAERMRDLVYNGGKKLPPAKFAKVAITIDNKNRKIPIEADEVKIIRKVDKDGKSLFKINGIRQSKEYIKNHLYQAGVNPDGYNIVMQGEIEKFISLSPEERRKMIEDLSGISIYEEKKHKSILELNRAQSKIKDANIILSEKKKHMENLQKEKDQAEKYSSIIKKFEFYKAGKLRKELKELNISKDQLSKKLKSEEEEVSKEKTERSKLISELDGNNAEIEGLNKELETQGETKQIELSKSIDVLRTNCNELKTLIKSETNEIIRMGARTEQLKKDLEINSEKRDEIKKRLSELLKNVEELKKGLALDEEKLNILTNLDRERLDLMSKIHKLELEIRDIKSKIGEFEGLKEKVEEERKLTVELKSLQEQLKRLLEENAINSKDLGNAIENREKIIKKVHSHEGRRQALLSLLDQGVKAIILAKDKGRLKGVYGVVSELGTTNEEYSVPLKVAAGNRINSIVVENVGTAKSCLEYLRKNERGIATFLPLDKIKARPEKTTKKEGIVNFAINLVKYDPKYKNVFDYVFGETIIVKDINAAKKLGIGKYRMVTLNGDLFEKSGAIRGGYRKKHVASFQEEQLNKKISEYKVGLKALDTIIKELEPKKEKSSDEIALIRSKIFNLEEKLKTFVKVDFSKLEDLKKISEDKEKNHKKLWERIKELPKKVAQEQLNKISARIKKQRETLSATDGESKGAEMELNLILRDIKRENELIKEIKKEKIEFKERVGKNEKELKIAEKDLNEKLEEEKKFYGRLKELYTKRNELMEVSKKKEIEREKIDSRLENLRKVVQDTQLKLAELNAKVEGKNTALEEYKDIEIKTIKLSIEELGKKIEEYEKRLENYGPVNMRALEVYTEIEKEYKELKEMVDKLLFEKEEILAALDVIELQKKETFMKVFSNVAVNFSTVFATLSIKGEGKLLLEDPENPFEGGLDIIARPGGKKMVSLRSMSGGEKTLTTLAFIFAVQEYDPSPFYILDEVDAALDKENSERLGILISEYSKTSQFIVISHNDSIISQADNVYGVHMNELGESHIVSIKLPEK